MPYSVCNIHVVLNVCWPPCGTTIELRSKLKKLPPAAALDKQTKKTVEKRPKHVFVLSIIFQLLHDLETKMFVLNER